MEERTIVVRNNLALFYKRLRKCSSSAYSVIYLHGGPGMPHNYLENLIVQCSFEDSIVYDQIGCGQSSIPDHKDADYSIQASILDLHELLKHLLVECAVFIGHSWGGILATEYFWYQNSVGFEDNYNISVQGMVLLGVPSCVRLLELEMQRQKQEILVESFNSRRAYENGNSVQCVSDESAAYHRTGATQLLSEEALHMEFLRQHFYQCGDINEEMRSLVDSRSPSCWRGIHASPELRAWHLSDGWRCSLPCFCVRFRDPTLRSFVASHRSRCERNDTLPVTPPPIPLCIITGEHDMVTKKCVEGWKGCSWVSGEANIKPAFEPTFVTIPNSSHMCMLESPSAVIRSVKAFVEEIPRAPDR